MKVLNGVIMEDKIEERGIKYFIIDITDTKFTLKKKHENEELPLLKKLIISRAMQGDTLRMILSDFHIPYSKWIKYLKRNKCLRTTLSDANEYRRAWGERWLLSSANSKAKNPRLIELALKAFYEIDETMEDDSNEQVGSGYKVKTTMMKEKE